MFLNGTKINEWVDDDPNVDLSQGHIGVQNHGTSGPDNPDEVFFRNIRIDDGSTPANNPPVADDESVTTNRGEPVDVDVLQGDTDPDGDTLSVSEVTDPANGTAAKNDDGTIKYTPDENFIGTDTFDYTVSDGNGGTDTGSVQVTVEEGQANASPTIKELRPRDGARTRDRTPAIGATVLDADGPLSAGGITLAVDGREVDTFTYDADTGRVKYAPERKLKYGRHKVRLTVQDGDGGSAHRAWSFVVENKKRR